MIRHWITGVLMLVGICVVSAQGTDEPPELKIGIKESPPFTIKQDDGTWTGISVELWDRIAAQQGIDYEWQEKPLADLLVDVEKGDLDAALAAITITSERERKLDFTHGYFISELSIATPISSGGGWAVVRAFLSPGFWKTVVALTLLLLVVGFGLWLAERRENAEQFGGSAPHGIGAAFWWAAVTMTTVGYGDKAPKTPLGRFLALIWMFAALIVISGFVAGMASALTVGNLSSKVNGPKDLHRVNVGTVDGSTSERYLLEHGIGARGFETVEDAWAALHASEIDAFVYDAPILRYMVNKQNLQGVKVLATGFERQYYGIALQDKSPWRERFNRSLLQITQSNEWSEVTARYLGQ